MTRKLIAFTLMISLVISLASCGQRMPLDKAPPLVILPSEDKKDEVFQPEKGYQISEAPTDYIDLEMGSGAHIVMRLFPECAPNTVKLIQQTVSKHLYDNCGVIEVAPGTWFRTGDPTNSNPISTDLPVVLSECDNNGIENPLPVIRGACTSLPIQGAGGTLYSDQQFCIITRDSAAFDDDIPVFGMVVSGIKEADRITRVRLNAKNIPIRSEYIKLARFVTPDEQTLSTMEWLPDHPDEFQSTGPETGSSTRPSDSTTGQWLPSELRPPTRTTESSRTTKGSGATEASGSPAASGSPTASGSPAASGSPTASGSPETTSGHNG